MAFWYVKVNLSLFVPIFAAIMYPVEAMVSMMCSSPNSKIVSSESDVGVFVGQVYSLRLSVVGSTGKVTLPRTGL